MRQYIYQVDLRSIISTPWHGNVAFGRSVSMLTDGSGKNTGRRLKCSPKDRHWYSSLGREFSCAPLISNSGQCSPTSCGDEGSQYLWLLGIKYNENN